MNRKEIVSVALNHQPTARVPLDFGATGVTGMHVTNVAALREYYGLEKRPVKVCEPYQMLGEIEDDLKDVIGIDTVPLSALNTLFGFRNQNWKEWRAPWGQDLLVAENFRTTVDANGDLLLYPQGDLTAPASGKMPKASFFFDAIIRQEPLVEEKLNPQDNLEEFGVISDQELQIWQQETAKVRTSERAVMASIGGMGLGDIALVPAINLKYPKGIRDVTEWYISTLTRRNYIHQIFEKQTEIALVNLEKLAPLLKDVVEVIFICGTDFGTQASTFCSPETFKSLYLPYYKKINAWIHQHTTWKTFKHSCGAVRTLIPYFIEAGFDILNPVQCSAANMDPRELKQEFGDRLVFWGGGVDTQKTLPFGTPEQVHKEVLERCEIFSQNGGFVFCTVHNVQANTSVANLVAMIDAVHEFNGER
jgi:hypothetical protein